MLRPLRQLSASSFTASHHTAIGEGDLSVNEVAKITGLSRWSVIRRFENLPGVIDHGSPETRHKRRYRVLRIPRSVLRQYLHQHRVDN